MRVIPLLVSALLGLASSGPLQAQHPLDAPFQVNVQEEMFETSPHLATNRSGEFVVAWAGGALIPGPSSTGSHLYAQRFGPDGRPETGVIQAADGVAPFSPAFAVALMEDGSFAVAFSQSRQTSVGIVQTLKVRWLTPEGVSKGDALVTRAPGDMVSMATAGDGGVVLAWSHIFGTDPRPVWAHAYGPDRAPLGPAVLVDPSGLHAVVAAAPDGSFAVAWQSVTPDSAPQNLISRVSLRRFAPDGSPRGSTLDVAGPFQSDGVNDPLPMIFVGIDGDRNVLVVWSQISGAPGTSSPSGRWYSPDGQPLGQTFVVPGGDGNAMPDAFALGDLGNFVLSWRHPDNTGTSDHVLTRRYSRDGSPIGSAVQADGNGLPFLRDESAVGVLPGGRRVVAWTDILPDGSPAIYARRFRSR